ncbi:hypothetical protein HDR62_07125 [bacterium]|nr:hypothetical protein [bacterium]
MYFIEWIKEWGDFVLTSFGIMGGLFMYFRHDKKINQQEKLLNDLQIGQYRKEEDQEKQAQVACNIVSDGKGSKRVYFYNSGLADARNVRIEILDRNSLKGVIINDKWGPYDLITPRNGRREERIHLSEGHTKVLNLRITWDDEFGNNRTILQSPQL